MKGSVSRYVDRFSLRGRNGIVVVAVLSILAFTIGAFFSGGEPEPAGLVSEAGPAMWTCSMHPQIKLSEPGQCPICGMDLIPLDAGSDDELGPRQIRMTASARELARIQTSVATREYGESEVRMYGKIAYDESSVAYITARVPGRLDRLYADYTGVVVKKGDHLVDMYSPQLVSAQEELIQAAAAVESLEKTSSTTLRTTALATLESAREKLRLYGLKAEQIGDIERTRTIREDMTIYAPAGGVVVHMNAREGMYVDTGTQIYTIADLRKLWVLFEAYESDLPWIHYGQRVHFTSQSFPGETFEAVISFVDPLVDPKTRTVRVRAVVDNAPGHLKPDMFVRGVLKSRLDADGNIIDIELAGKWMCPMHPEVVKTSRGTCDECGMDLVSAVSLGFVRGGSVPGEAPIMIPASAPLITGKRAVVYVEVSSDDGYVFEGREVELGPRAGNLYVVKSGIAEGDVVVTNGAFKIDSELQIRAQPSMMSPTDGGMSPAKRHGPTTVPVPATETAGQESDAALRSLTPVYTSYISVQTALADDDADTARKAGRALAQQTRLVDMSLFSSSGHRHWMNLSATIAEPADKIAATDNIKVMREAFYDLSNAVITLQKVFGHVGEQVFYRKFCPMARQGDGAFWLQQVEETWNPYYGSAMQHCGSTKEVLAARAQVGVKE